MTGPPDFAPANKQLVPRPTEHDIDRMEAEVAEYMGAILRVMRIEYDHNTKDTPRRIAKMWVREVCSGRVAAPPKLTDFPNIRNLDQVYAVGPIAVRSCCAHHFVPILGKAWIGVLPGERLIGLSKFHRMTDWIMSRPQIQEEATEQLADVLVDAIRPRGLAVIVRARHFCTAWRGVRDEPSMLTTSVMRGVFLQEPAARTEFMELVKGMGF